MSNEDRLWRRWLTPRVGAELIAIAIGVFIGLAADAAWDARNDRLLETEYLRALRIEMSGAAEELADDNALRASLVARIDTIKAEARTRVSSDEAMSRRILSLGSPTGRFFPPSEVLDELTSSESLRLLRSADLRFALMAYQRERERLNYLEDFAITTMADRMLPYLILNFREIPGDAASSRDPVHHQSSVSSILSDPVFHNLLEVGLQRLGLVERRSTGLVGIIERVRELIDKEVGRPAF